MTPAKDNGAESDPAGALEDEDRQMRRLRIIVDLTAAVLAQEKMTIDEALDLINATRRTVLHLFPGKEHAFDIIYARRFARILRERFGPETSERDEEAEEA